MRKVLVCNLLVGIFMSSAWAGPQKKVTEGAELSIKESYSVAMTGMETETFRVQHLLLKGKTFFMASKLVNGNLYTEKPISAAEFNGAKKAIFPLAALGNSDLCTKPASITIATAQKTENKVCSEKTEVMADIAKFNDQVKGFISKD